MLVSYLHNFIFFKTQKTGGTTVEAVLAPLCGPDDVVTPLGANDEMARSHGKPICRNFGTTREQEQEYIDAIVHDVAREDRPLRSSLKFNAHMNAEDIKAKVEPEFWSKAFKFTIERHPYEKVVSKAFFILGPSKDAQKFPRILDRVLARENFGSLRYYAIEGRVVVDEIMRLENLDADLRRVGDKLGLKLPEELPRMKSLLRRDPRPASEILTDEQKEHIYRVSKAEFDLLGYEP